MDLLPEIYYISNHINELRKWKYAPVMVAVCGGTSTCKSTMVTNQIWSQVGTGLATIIELDNFQKGRESKNLIKGSYGHDNPEYFEVGESYSALKTLSENKQSNIPEYSYTLGKQTGYKIIQPAPVIVYEGLFAAYKELAALADLVVYVESPLYARLLRRIFRNTYDRYNAMPERAFTNFFPTLNAHNELIAAQKDNADYTILVPYQFEDTIIRYNLSPISEQKKVDFTFCFDLSNDTKIGVYKNFEQLNFTLLHCNKMYLDFEITFEQYEEILKLDFMSL